MRKETGTSVGEILAYVPQKPTLKIDGSDSGSNSLFNEFKKNLERADRLSAQVEFLLKEVHQIVKRN